MKNLETNITVETTLVTNNNRVHGWKGYGTIGCPACGNEVDAGTGDHSLVEELYCANCDLWFEVDWDEMLNQKGEDE